MLKDASYIAAVMPDPVKENPHAPSIVFPLCRLLRNRCPFGVLANVPRDDARRFRQAGKLVNHGSLNLKDPKAMRAGLNDRTEPIQIYAHVLRHPTHGLFMVDTGVSKRLVQDPAGVGVGWVVRQFSPIKKMQIRQDTLSIINSESIPLKGIFLTHLHLDHISGMPDVPEDIPIYTGPGEAGGKKFENVFVQGMEDRFFEGRSEIQEFQFTRDPDGKLDGVVDIFGDGSLFAILTPGHTAGHLSFVVRTPNGPVLLTGDACHTRWGWENGVEPGSYTFDRESEQRSLRALKALSERHPQMVVRLGHQI
jgi:N-acyl homoserine lactone hydrolase